MASLRLCLIKSPSNSDSPSIASIFLQSPGSGISSKFLIAQGSEDGKLVAANVKRRGAVCAMHSYASGSHFIEAFQNGIFIARQEGSREREVPCSDQSKETARILVLLDSGFQLTIKDRGYTFVAEEFPLQQPVLRQEESFNKPLVLATQNASSTQQNGQDVRTQSPIESTNTGVEMVLDTPQKPQKKPFERRNDESPTTKRNFTVAELSSVLLSERKVVAAPQGDASMSLEYDEPRVESSKNSPEAGFPKSSLLRSSVPTMIINNDGHLDEPMEVQDTPPSTFQVSPQPDPQEGHVSPDTLPLEFNVLERKRNPVLRTYGRKSKNSISPETKRVGNPPIPEELGLDEEQVLGPRKRKSGTGTANSKRRKRIEDTVQTTSQNGSEPPDLAETKEGEEHDTDDAGSEHIQDSRSGSYSRSLDLMDSFPNAQRMDYSLPDSTATESNKYSDNIREQEAPAPKRTRTKAVEILPPSTRRRMATSPPALHTQFTFQGSSEEGSTQANTQDQIPAKSVKSTPGRKGRKSLELQTVSSTANSEKYAGDPIRVVFSNSSLDGRKDIQQFLKSHGGRKAETITSPTTNFLVVGTGALKRTTKFTLAVALGKTIVTDQWLLESKDAGCFLNPEPYVPSDPTAEKEWGIDLGQSLQRGKNGQLQTLFSEHTIYITPSLLALLKAGKQELDYLEIIRVAGTKSVLKKIPRTEYNPSVDANSIVLGLNAEEGEKDFTVLTELGWKVYRRDWLALSVLRGEVLTGKEWECEGGDESQSSEKNASGKSMRGRRSRK